MVLITGFSGRFPSSNSVNDFWNKLCLGIDLVTENSSRYPQGYSNLPDRQAQVKNIEKFDALFFGISSSQASCLDPQIRLLLEAVYEAIVDAGYTMEDLAKTNTGVYVGGCFSDMHKALLKDVRTITGYENTGCSHSMFANRVSFCFDFTGPSMTIDTACSSSLVALDLATRDIRSGKINRAIVAGVSIAVDPGVTKSFSAYGMLSPNGKCHSFDDKANGYVRADGIGAILLESELVCKTGGILRILGTGVNSDGSKVKGITYPDSNQQKTLCNNVCNEYNINSNNVIYVEAHGTGTVAGDGQELRAISAAYAPIDSNRSIRIGSVKSNMGHAEGASGIMSLIKTLCIVTDNIIPTNLHYNGTTIHEPILSGRLQVVDETQPFIIPLTPRLSDESLDSNQNDNIDNNDNNDNNENNNNSLVIKSKKLLSEYEQSHPLIAINNFGFGGTNAHLVCCYGDKELVVTSNKTRYIFGRTEESLYTYFNNNELNEAAWQLLHRHSSNTSKFSWRGIVKSKLDNNNNNNIENENINDISNLILETQKVNTDKPLIAYCYTGQGCQWNGMGKDLWLNESNSRYGKIFKSTIIEACDGLDVNINELFSSGDCWMNKKWSGFGITLVQLGLTAILKDMGIIPDFIFGHSVGEVACGYADGCTSSKEAARIAFIRCQLSDKIASHGLMLAVGLDYDTAQQLIQPFNETVIACHNSPDGVTLSGSESEIQTITNILKEKGVFAKIVPTDGIAYHSKFFQRNSDKIQEVLDTVITDKPSIKRTSRWLSTSCSDCRNLIEHQCYEYPDSFYHTRNIIGQVNFEPIVKSLPTNTIVIEIGPHNLLKGIIKRCREEGQEVSIYSVMQRGENTFNSIQKLNDTLWLNGVIFNFPIYKHMVPIKDRINISWDHDTDWRVPGFKDFERSTSKSSMLIEFNLAGSDSYLMDHIIDGRSILPATAHIYCAWLAYGTDEIHFVDIKILSAIILDGISVSLNVVTDSNHWKIYHDDKLVSQGSIAAQYQIPSLDYAMSTSTSTSLTLTNNNNNQDDNNNILNNETWIESNDVYSRFARYGYEYGEEFRAISSRSISGNYVRLRPVKQWIVYLDNMLQAFLHKPKGLYLPTSIGTISIRCKDVTKVDTLLVGNTFLNSFGNRDVIIRDLKTTLARKFHKSVNMCGVEFIPYGEHIIKSSDEEFKKNLIKTLIQINDFNNNNNTNSINNKNNLKEKLFDERIITYLEAVHNIISNDNDNDNDSLDSSNSNDNNNDNDNNDESEKIKENTLIPSYDESLYTDDAILSCKWCINELKVISQIIRENISTSYTLLQYGDAARHHKYDALYYQIHSLVQSDVLSFTSSDHDPNNVFPTANHVDVILANNFFYRSHNILTTLKNVTETIKLGGFLLLREYIGYLPTLLWGDKISINDIQDKRQYGRWINIEKWLELINESGLQSVMWCYDESKTQILLLAYKPLPLSECIIESHHLIKSNLSATLETNDYGYLGTIRSIRKEPGYDGIKLRLDVTDYLNNNINNDNNNNINNLIINNLERSTAILPISVYYNGILGGFHEVTLQNNQLNKTRGYYLKVLKPGDLQSLTWVENDIEPNCEVKYCGVNFKDVMLSYGKLTTNDENGHVKIGLEYSGIVNGKSVMGISFGCMATHIKTTPHLMWDLPSTLTLEEGCTIPVVYSTVYYALVIKANIQAGQTVLIHSIAGGVGQAAYHVCKHRGVNVIATCSKEKMNWVHENLNIPYEYILDSHTLKFRDDVLYLTNGRGVDVVLNSLSGDKLHASMECVAQYGHFCEIGKFDIQQNTKIGMSLFERNVSMHGFDLSDMFTKVNLWQPIRNLMIEGLKSGEIKPLCSTIFDNPEQALRYVGTGKHIGKVIVRINNINTLINTPDINGNLIKPHSNYRTHGTHLVIGGLGGFGMELVLFLKLHGAEKIIISSRNKPKPSQLLILTNNENDNSIEFVHSNLKEYDICNDLISSIGNNLIGIWHLGMVLNDCLYSNMNEQLWYETVSTKATICSNLDRTSRIHCPKLEQFVMWSSVTSLFGNAGQTNYAYGNSVMEGICLLRKSLGLPGTAIQWGFIGTVGVLMKKGQTTNHSLGFYPQHIDSCLESLNTILSSNIPHAIVSSYIRRVNDLFNDDNDDSNGSTKVLKVTDRIARVLGVDINKLSGNEMLSSLGMDSMQSVEISNILKSIGFVKSLEELRYVTWNELVALN